MNSQGKPPGSNARKHIPIDVEIELLSKSRRRCCVCFGLHGDFDPKPGQFAHLDKTRKNSTLTNLAWLCLEHHDQYDSVTSQTKGLKPHEVKLYRDELYSAIQKQRAAAMQTTSKGSAQSISLWNDDVSELVKELRGTKVADKMIQYRGYPPTIGLCRLRIYDIRGRQLVVIISQFPDNPGTSITNVAESLATQIYHEELKYPRNGVVWIEHYVAPYGVPELETYSQVSFTLVSGEIMR